MLRFRSNCELKGVPSMTLHLVFFLQVIIIYLYLITISITMTKCEIIKKKVKFKIRGKCVTEVSYTMLG